MLSIELDHEEVDTIGGYVLSKQSDIEVGTIVEAANIVVEVLEAEASQIKKVSIKLHGISMHHRKISVEEGPIREAVSWLKKARCTT